MATLQRPKAPACQSCGMPMESPQLLGTDAAGLRVADYCMYCYRKGAFTEPAISRDEMTTRVIDILVKKRHLPEMQARAIAESTVVQLKRWSASPEQARR